MPQVSVLLLTYNSDPGKLRRTLAAIARQKEVSLQVIISDDGSSKKDFSFLEGFMKELGLSDWKLLEHPVNRGTVQSCLSAAQAATGMYAFTTSPGDFLFDDYVLRDFFQFAQAHKCPLCFGTSVYYHRDSDGIHTRPQTAPLRPVHYAPDASLHRINTSFFAGDWVIGGAYFRSVPLMVESLQAIAGKVIYTEDTPSTMYLLAKGCRMCYYDRKMIWYEYGTGISTGANASWIARVEADIQAGYALLRQKFPRNPYLDRLCRSQWDRPKWRRSLGNLLRHPLIVIEQRLLRCTPPKTVSCTAEDLSRLQTLLETDC